MSHTWFISDLHLDSSRPAVTRAFQAFLHGHRDCEALYILGDLFEAWIGDDDDAALGLEVAASLAEFSASGPALFLMRGNRDFLLGEAFCESAGGELLADPSVIDLYGRRVLLMHGDSLCTADTAYQDFRAMARSPDWQADLMARPLEERRALASQLRDISQEANSNKAEDIMDVTPSEVERVMQAHHVGCMIHGHTHRPRLHQQAQGERWVLGDWHEHAWVIRANGEAINLIKFDINQ